MESVGYILIQEGTRFYQLPWATTKIAMDLVEHITDTGAGQEDRDEWIGEKEMESRASPSLGAQKLVINHITSSPKLGFKLILTFLVFGSKWLNINIKHREKYVPRAYFQWCVWEDLALV